MITGRTLFAVAGVGELLTGWPGLPARILSRGERGRLMALRSPAQRAEFVAARLLTRLLVVAHDGNRLTPTTVAAVRLRQSCRRCARPHGRPRVVGRDRPHVSWSHAREVVAAVAGTGPVAIDVERFDGRVGDGLVGRFATSPDTERQLGWTRAEACVKLGLADLDTALEWPLAAPAAVATPLRGLVGPGLADVGPSVLMTDFTGPAASVGSMLSTGPATRVPAEWLTPAATA